MGLTRGDRKRERIYNIYSKNLALVKKHPKFSMEPDLEDAYVCPLCFNIFTRNALKKKYNDHLTLEDIPPKSLGGSPKILTCKICNNTHGSKIDKHLVESLKTRAFIEGKVGSKRDMKLSVNQNAEIRGSISRSKETDFIFKIDKRRSHPEAYKSNFEEFKHGKNQKVEFSFSGEYNIKRSRIALLRIGYLWLFSKFGYAALINNYMHLVREQISNPKEKVLPIVFIPEVNFPDEFEGVNIVTFPKELRAFAVLFKIQNERTSRKHVVLLPGPSDPGIDIYKFIKKKSDEKSKVNIDFTKLNLDGVLNNENNVYAYHEIWQNFYR